MEAPAWMTRQPGQHFWVLVGGIVVEDDMDRPIGRDLALDSIEEADEFEVGRRCMQRPITVPSSTLSTENRVVMPCRL